MSGKPAFIKPVHTLTASSIRMQEHIKGRLLFVHTEVFKGGHERVIATIVDKDKMCALKSVLVLEAWQPGDKTRMQKTLKPLQGKVVSITNAKIMPRGKSIVFFDAEVKCAFDQYIAVAQCPDDDSYPAEYPVLPNLKVATSLSHSCMVSLVAAVTEEGRAVERVVSPTVKKCVAHLKMATETTNMTAAFWDDLAEKMSVAKVGQVYRLDWVLLKQEGAGRYALASVPHTTVVLTESEVAAVVQDNLANPSQMVNMSCQYGQTYTDKMKKPVAQADLYALEEIQSLQMQPPGVLQVPACYVIEARGMTADSPNRAWYTGCTQCKRQLETVTGKLPQSGSKRHRTAPLCTEWRRMRQQVERTECPQHGANKGQKIYAGSVMLADPSHKIELAVWDDMLHRLIKNFLGHEDMESESVMEDLCEALKGIELVVRVGVTMKKHDASVSFDLFDVAEQINSDGCLALYKTIVHSFGPGLPGIVPACCRHVIVNDLGQLTVTAGDAELLAETVKLMVRVVKHEDLKVPDGIDALEVSLKCECVCCKKECLLYAAGVPQTVQAYLRIAAGEHLMAFLHTAESDYKFPVGYHVSLKDRTDVAIDERVFKWQAAQVMNRLSICDVPTETDEKEINLKRRQSMEALLTCERAQSKRLKIAKTDDGSAFI